ncbi:hypothetical protein GcLGCM259_0279 [Glutamicibacter creatinolyticus]|uniref:Type II toxin-antitoxin system VapB family antitoxin n=1 Tax=Glutamicibacter creatinolyticus TaxID=162496 RepID=A0A5B7WPT3_9MICC|nr:hypothetical protein GcLGCM259_0279 [Glutamicibacter creatinolyticus]
MRRNPCFLRDYWGILPGDGTRGRCVEDNEPLRRGHGNPRGGGWPHPLRCGSGPTAVFYAGGVIFKAVGEQRPYPEHQMRSTRDWSAIPPQQVRLEELTTTKRTLDLEALLAEDSTFFGDLFPHVVRWQGNLYLEDGLHRAVRTALHHRSIMHARVLNLDE